MWDRNQMAARAAQELQEPRAILIPSKALLGHHLCQPSLFHIYQGNIL